MHKCSLATVLIKNYPLSCLRATSASPATGLPTPETGLSHETARKVKNSENERAKRMSSALLNFSLSFPNDQMRQSHPPTPDPAVNHLTPTHISYLTQTTTLTPECQVHFHPKAFFYPDIPHISFGPVYLKLTQMSTLHCLILPDLTQLLSHAPGARIAARRLPRTTRNQPDKMRTETLETGVGLPALNCHQYTPTNAYRTGIQQFTPESADMPGQIPTAGPRPIEQHPLHTEWSAEPTRRLSRVRRTSHPKPPARL